MSRHVIPTVRNTFCQKKEDEISFTYKVLHLQSSVFYHKKIEAKVSGVFGHGLVLKKKGV